MWAVTNDLLWGHCESVATVNVGTNKKATLKLCFVSLMENISKTQIGKIMGGVVNKF